MPLLQLLPLSQGEKIISENPSLLNKLTSMPVCGIWLQPELQENSLWISDSFWNFMGYGNKDEHSRRESLEAEALSVLEDVRANIHKEEFQFKKRFPSGDGNGLLVRVMVQKVAFHQGTGILYRFQRYEAKLNPGDKQESFQDLIKIFNETNELARVGAGNWTW